MKATRQAARHRRGRLGLMVGTPVALIAAGGLVYGTANGATSGGAPVPAPAAVNHAQSGVVAAVTAMQPGWNLGNSLDAIPAETSWDNPVVAKAQLDAIRAQGFRSIRIPVTWSAHQGSGPPSSTTPPGCATRAATVSASTGGPPQAPRSRSGASSSRAGRAQSL